jgi:alkylated DNA repair dioxygenase AlkB
MEKPSLKTIENFVSNPDELFIHLRDSVKWDERMKSRKTASFGVSYDYSGIAYPETPMKDELVYICKKIEKELYFLPNNCLINYYLDGDSSMGYHSDSSKELSTGTGVAIISLGAERHISYKSKSNNEIIIRHKLLNGMLLYMDIAVQEQWLHAIPKEPGLGQRIILTFRKIIK